jgi:hypothetical protein
MKIIRWMLMFATITTGTSIANAQHPVYIYGAAENPPSVVSAIRARIGGSSRYTLVNTFVEGELILNLVCIETKAHAGFVCAYGVNLYGKNTSPLGAVFGTTHVAISPDEIKMGEDVFEDFVEDTSEDKIKKSEEQTRVGVAVFCMDAANKRFCQPPK